MNEPDKHLTINQTRKTLDHEPEMQVVSWDQNGGVLVVRAKAGEVLPQSYPLSSEEGTTYKLLPESQGQNLALTVFCVPCSAAPYPINLAMEAPHPKP